MDWHMFTGHWHMLEWDWHMLVSSGAILTQEVVMRSDGVIKRD
jgi:hypothetical protein